MLTQIRKIGFIPLFSPGVTPAALDTLGRAGITCAAFASSDKTALQTASARPDFMAGVTEVSSLNEAHSCAASGAKFIALSAPSDEQTAWAQEAGLVCVQGSELLGGVVPVPTEISQDENALAGFLQQKIRVMLGFDLRHVGINSPDENTSSKTADAFERIFGFPKTDRGGAYFAGEIIEVMKKPFYGTHGHIAIATRSAESAAYYLEHAGVTLNWQSAGYNPDGRLRVVYLQEEIGGFAVHILQK